MRDSLKLSVLAAATALALVLWGCNGMDGLGGSSSGSGNQSATGVWSGTDAVSGLALTAFINSSGQATFIRSDGVLFTGSTQVSGISLAATVDGYVNYPATFSDGSNYGIGTLNGTVSTGTSIAATLSFNTNGGTAINGSWPLSYEATSNNSSSPATVSGNYTDTVTGQVLAINSNGVMSQQNASGTTFSGCVLNGTISTSDTTHNVYEVSYTLASCTGSAQALNGIQFTGLASLNSAQSPAQLTIAVTGSSSSGTQYGIVSTLTGS
jgi:hypothetical protein